MIAYLITNTKNGKKYVGITTRNLSRRWYEHQYVPNSCGQLLGKAIKKYGNDAFKIEHIASSKFLEDLKEIEKLLIDQHNTKVPNGYNLTDGGDGIFGFKHDPETVKRIADLKRGTEASEETKAKMSEAHRGEKNHFFGKKHTEEANRKNSEAHKGNKNMLGKKHTIEALEKMRIAKLGKQGKTGNTKGLIVATNVLTGETILLDGAKDIVAKGFYHTCVYRCLAGKTKTHKNFTFERI